MNKDIRDYARHTDHNDPGGGFIDFAASQGGNVSIWATVAFLVIVLIASIFAHSFAYVFGMYLGLTMGALGTLAAVAHLARASNAARARMRDRARDGNEEEPLWPLTATLSARASPPRSILAGVSPSIAASMPLPSDIPWPGT